MTRDHTLPAVTERWPGFWAACDEPERPHDNDAAYFVACDGCAVKARLVLAAASLVELARIPEGCAYTVGHLLTAYLADVDRERSD